MRKILLALTLSIILGSLFNTTYAYKIGHFADIKTDIIKNEDVEIGSSTTFNGNVIKVNGDLTIGSSANINGNINVDGDFNIGSSASIDGNIIVTGDITIGHFANVTGTISGKNIKIGSSAQLEGKIYSSNGLSVGSSTNIKNGVEVNGDFNAKSSLDLTGKSKISGDFNYGHFANMSDTIYVYGTINNSQESFSSNLKGHKTKITGDISLGSSNTIESRLYLYGEKKEIGSSYYEELNNYTGFFGKIDPILQYNLSESQIKIIKNKIDNYFAQAKQTPNNKIDIYNEMFAYLSLYIESETFDKNIFNTLKKEYTGSSDTAFTTKNQSKTEEKVVATRDNFSPFLPKNLEQRLDKIFDNISQNEQRTVITQINRKIDTMVVKLKSDVNKNRVKINLLLGIKQHLETKLSTPSNDDILKELGL